MVPKTKTTPTDSKLSASKKLTPKAVILAAEREEALGESQKRHPKPMTPILGVPLLERLVYTLKRGGAKQTIVVTGYRSQSIRKRLGDGSKLDIKIKYAHNREYTKGNVTSLKAARKYLPETEPFLLLTADNLVSAKIIKKALSNLDRTPLLTVDFKPHYSRQVENATKVFVNKEGSIVNIGKNIRKWNAIFTGVLLLDNTIFNTIEQLEKTQAPTITECIKQAIDNGTPVGSCDVSNHFWFHVDTPEDVSFVERLLKGSSKN
jgi:NDP-sugar pyrophosphorylase family protein